ncbi:winged helix DNA-binding protein [Sphingomonas tabacisoli]|uniref:Winged helix DNA-binding protein n=1 Tax=Sphingomonas tabacisoli TaxID=2249466 RepID=A0ABW4I1E5_9SPHN
MIVADRAEEQAAATAAAHAAGARVIGVERVDAALDRLSQVSVDAVLIELGGSDAAARDRLLDWTNRAVSEGSTSAIVSIPHALVDDVMARLEEPRVSLLCDAGLQERATELAVAFAKGRNALNDQGVEAEAERLRRLSEEVARIAGALAEISSTARPYAPPAPRDDVELAAEPQMDANMVRNLIRIRRLREQFFSKDLFADPAWDMLLDLLAARLERSRVAVSSLCIAAAVPATTALRWIRTLTEHGLFVRRDDPEDGRRIFIELSDAATDAMHAYFQTAHQMGLRL